MVIQLANLSNFICPHQGFCHPDCYERQRRSCSRLITAVKKIYESSPEEKQKESEKKLDQKRNMLKERFKRRVCLSISPVEHQINLERYFNPAPHNPNFERTLKRRFLKTLWETEKNNAGNQHFLLFPQCFQPFPKQISSFQ